MRIGSVRARTSSTRGIEAIISYFEGWADAGRFSSLRYYTIRYDTIRYYNILPHTIYYTIIWCTIQYFAMLYRTGISVSYPTLVHFLNIQLSITEPNMFGALGWDRILRSVPNPRAAYHYHYHHLYDSSAIIIIIIIIIISCIMIVTSLLLCYAGVQRPLAARAPALPGGPDVYIYIYICIYRERYTNSQ